VVGPSRVVMASAAADGGITAEASAVESAEHALPPNVAEPVTSLMGIQTVTARASTTRIHPDVCGAAVHRPAGCRNISVNVAGWAAPADASSAAEKATIQTQLRSM